jgi:hypothetical protein
MTLTNFPNGITNMGVPILGGGAGLRAYRNVYFVDHPTKGGSAKGSGSDGNSGLSLQQAFATVQKALDTVTDEDTIIVMRGSYDEKLSTGLTPGSPTAVGVPDPGRGRYVNLIGVTQGFLPFDSPQLYNVSGADWSLNIRAQGWRVSGFRIVGDSGSPVCIRINQDGSTATPGIEWAAGTTVDNCVFYGAVGSTAGIMHTEAGNCRFVNNQFELFSAALAALGDDGTGTEDPGRCIIQGNWFMDNVINVKNSYNNSVIAYNLVGMNKENTMTHGVDLRNGANNAVYGNQFHGTYNTIAGSGFYNAGTNDDWSGNYTLDITSGGADAATGITWKIPQAS